MNYESFDSSGTDDDLPPSHQNRMSRAGGLTRNGRTTPVGSLPHPRTYGETDMDSQIRQIEQEAYISVLRAFIAQADAITWEKESLITELRKELRLSNEEHRELLARVNSEDLIRRIREWRQAGGHQAGGMNSSQAIHDIIPSPTVSASRKKHKITQPPTSQPFAGLPPSFHPSAVTNQQPSAAKRGSIIGAKGKKHKPIFPSTSSTKPALYSSITTGRGQNFHPVCDTVVAEPVEANSLSSLVGRRIRTKWPDDNNFYDALITDYNRAEGLHTLVYDMDTDQETWEWVNLSEISPEDIQWEGEDPGILYKGGLHGSSIHGSRVPPRTGRGRGGIRKGPFRNNGIGKKVYGNNNIKILHTDSLIKEVEKVFGSNNQDSFSMERAKTALKEHEQALVEAIQRLAELSDGE